MKKIAGFVIKSIRKKLGYKQEYVAQKLNISTSTLQHVENGRVTIDIERLCALAAIFRVLPKQLLELILEVNENGTIEGLDQAVSYLTKVIEINKERDGTKP